jgi:pimeloyl-ACP methyl ester carboxylesterase
LDAEYSFGYLADFVREFQDALGLARSHVVGHSMGGWVASVFAYESPNRVDKLVLVASGGTSTRTLRSMTEFTPPSRDDVRKGLEARVRAPGADLDALADADFAKTQVPGALDAYRKILRHMNDPANRQRYNTLRRLPLIQAPTLVVWGTADQTNALEMGEETARLIPGARLAVVEGCGHFIPTERPDELNRLLLEFL